MHVLVNLCIYYVKRLFNCLPISTTYSCLVFQSTCICKHISSLLFFFGGGCINIILHDTLYLSSFYFIFYLAFRIIWHNTFSSVWTYINLVCYNYCIMMRVGPSSITYQPLQTINDRIFACKWNVAYFIHVYKYDSKFIHTIK